MLPEIERIIGREGLKSLLDHKPVIDKKMLSRPCSDHLLYSDRSPAVLRSIRELFMNGRLNNGYLSILPLDHGIEHGAVNSFHSNLAFFNPDHIFRLAIEAGCNALVSTLGTLGMVSRKYAGKIPLVLKLNHNEPNSNRVSSQSFHASVDQAFNLGASGVAATLYFGAEDYERKVEEVSAAFEYAHEKGLFTILWAYVRKENVDPAYNTSAFTTGQANYMASLVQADIVKQKFPQNCNFATENANSILTSHPIDMVRYQVLNCMAGSIPLLNSGGQASDEDEKDLVFSALVNKLAGGAGIMAGRKIFKKDFKESLRLLNLVQDIYLSKEIELL